MKKIFQDQYADLQLFQIKRALNFLASKKTSSYPDLYDSYSEKCKLAFHGEVASYVLWKRWGGKLKATTLKCSNLKIYHIWNELPSGLMVDLTSHQFNGDGFRPVLSATGSFVWRKPSDKSKDFYDDFLKILYDLELETMWEVSKIRNEILKAG